MLSGDFTQLSLIRGITLYEAAIVSAGVWYNAKMYEDAKQVRQYFAAFEYYALTEQHRAA